MRLHTEQTSYFKSNMFDIKKQLVSLEIFGLEKI